MPGFAPTIQGTEHKRHKRHKREFKLELLLFFLCLLCSFLVLLVLRSRFVVQSLVLLPRGILQFMASSRVIDDNGHGLGDAAAGLG